MKNNKLEDKLVRTNKDNTSIDIFGQYMTINSPTT